MFLFKQIFRDKWLSAINIVGLSIGLAVPVMLLLFVTNELSFDRHFANSERIVSLNTVWHKNTGIEHLPVNLRSAYTEIPNMVSGINACTQIYKMGSVEVIHKLDHFKGLQLFFVDPEFFEIFQLSFIEGNPETSLTNPKTLVITRQYANVIFGSPSAAVGKTISISGNDYTIDAVVEQLPSNTHFSFDILGEIKSHSLSVLGGLEFFTFYLIKSEASVNDVRHSIERAYGEILSDDFVKRVNAECYGETENLTDLYLYSKADYGLGKRSNFQFILLLGGLSFIILLFAITNFMNLFLIQGETRMVEIGIRKANGAGISDLVKQFFAEVFVVTLFAFSIGFIITLLLFPHFSKLIERDVTLVQLNNPWFFVGALVVLGFTVFFSAVYPSFYLSRFKPLDVLAKRISLGKFRFSIIVSIFQFAITYALIFYVLVVHRQTSHMKNLPIGYNPKNVMMVSTNRTTALAYESLRQELQSNPLIKEVSAATHIIGDWCSGQRIGMPDDDESMQSVNEYRIMPGLGELMEIELIEGNFFKEYDQKNSTSVVLNDAAVRMLGMHPPYVGKEVIYTRVRSTIIGVTKDFYYDEPGFKVMPLVFSCYRPALDLIYIRFNNDINRIAAMEIVAETFKKFDPEFVLEPLWSENIIYGQKFFALKTHTKIILFSSLLSIVIAMMGLLAVQSFITNRRTKEIGIRRVHGASKMSIVGLLTFGIIKWIVAATIMAMPIAYLLSSNWLNNYANKTTISWTVYATPIIIQCLIATFVILGVSHKVVSANPVEALQNG